MRYNARRRHSDLSPIEYERNQLLPLIKVRNRPQKWGTFKLTAITIFRKFLWLWQPDLAQQCVPLIQF